MKEVLITVCGRGGSKGIANKNLRTLCGVPLIAWTLHDAENALEGREGVRKTIVADSDSDEILSAARAFCPGALLHKRSEALAGDSVAKMDTLRGLLADLENDGMAFDALIDLDITSPLRTFEDVEAAYDLFDRGEREVVFSVVPARRNPYFNMVEINDTGRGALCKPSEFVARQQAPRVYEMNASIYVYRPEVFRGEVRVPTRLDFGVFEMRDYGIIDIDTEGDLKMMELLLGSGEDLLAEGLLNKKLALVRGKRARMEGAG